MSVYNVDGLPVTSLYTINGNDVVSAYSLDGAEVFTKAYPIENLESYFKTEVQSVANDVNSLSDDWQSFVFITDPHGSANKQHSQAIGLYLLANTKAAFLVLNGDYSAGNWSKSQYDNYVAPLIASGYKGRIYATLGNHETYGGGSKEAKQSIYNDFLKDKSNIKGVPTENYYYLDDTEHKTRYLFLNTSDGGEYTMTQTQIAWISQNVIMPSTEWALVVIGHVNLVQMAGVTYMNEANGSAIITAIENCNGTIVGYICGHQHIDYCEKIGNFQHTTLLCDRFENSNYYNGISVTNRVSGTDSEQAVSVISINTKTKDVVVRRVGAGRNRTISYSYA